MFRKGSLQDADMVLVYNSASKWEADIAKKLLEEAGIAALVMDREDSGAYLRIIGLGSPFGMDVYVNRMYEAQAKQLIKEAFSQKEDLSDQELEELAMETHSDVV